MSSNNHHAYSAQNIGRINPIEHIRRRPGMYMGGTDQRALQNILWVVLDESLLEAKHPNSPCNTITITRHSPTALRIEDNGIGIPATKHSSGKIILEAYMTETWQNNLRTSLLDSTNLTYGRSLFGVGLMAVTALSAFAMIESKHNGYLWRQSYTQGLASTDVQQIRALEPDEQTGTAITFTPDFSIMDEGLTFDLSLMRQYVEQLAYLSAGTRFIINVKDEVDTQYRHPNGIVDLVVKLAGNHFALSPVVSTNHEVCYVYRTQQSKITLRLALQFTLSNEPPQIISYVNTMATELGGVHCDSLPSLILQTLFGDPPHRHTQLLLRGMIAVVHLEHPEPYFESGWQKRLTNTEVEAILEQAYHKLVSENAEAFAKVQGALSY